MIKYALKCTEGHGFESWFQSADAFESLRKAGHVTCPVCGDTCVEKALMAPKLAPKRGKDAAPPGAPPMKAALEDPEIATALKRMKAEVEANSDYVGDRFASEARAIHLDEAPPRAIHGEAKPEEAKALADEGVPILPLPFRPTRKTN
ncbi:MAG: DUF1178 family protein [Pseudomonadota bacterium]